MKHLNEQGLCAPKEENREKGKGGELSVPQKERGIEKSKREEFSVTEIQKKKCKKVTDTPSPRCATTRLLYRN
ncbi:hypothetical protein AAHH67_06440 [Niallia circulans]